MATAPIPPVKPTPPTAPTAPRGPLPLGATQGPQTAAPAQSAPAAAKSAPAAQESPYTPQMPPTPASTGQEERSAQTGFSVQTPAADMTLPTSVYLSLFAVVVVAALLLIGLRLLKTRPQIPPGERAAAQPETTAPSADPKAAAKKKTPVKSSFEVKI